MSGTPPIRPPNSPLNETDDIATKAYATWLDRMESLINERPSNRALDSWQHDARAALKNIRRLSTP